MTDLRAASGGLRAMARATPTDRDRCIDFLRVAAILFVVSGHWLLAVVYRGSDENSLAFDWLIRIAPWSVWLSWIYQVMPVVFMVGGYSNSVSWRSARRRGQSYGTWAGARLVRLLVPVVPLALLWLAAAAAALAMGVDPGLARAASQTALGPTWFLSVYVLITLATPPLMLAWRFFGPMLFWMLAAGALTLDLATLGSNPSIMRWGNYALVWLAVTALGLAWRDGQLHPGRPALGLVAAGAAGLALCVGMLGYPVAMVTVPGLEMSNSRPPSTALLSLAMVQIGLIAQAAPVLRARLARERLWMAVIAGNLGVMTLYLWHQTAFVLTIGISWYLLGGFGLGLVPDSAAWWFARPPWLLAFAGVTILLVWPLTGIDVWIRSMTLEVDGRLAVAFGIVAGIGLMSLATGGTVNASGHLRVLPVLAVCFGALAVWGAGQRASGRS